VGWIQVNGGLADVQLMDANLSNLRSTRVASG
jgi:hypothetical protein